MKKKICIVTGSRSEYGLLRWLMEDIKNDSNLSLQLVVTGSHLLDEYGNTQKEIKKDGFVISKKVDTFLKSDTPLQITESIGRGLLSFPQTLKNLKPNILILLGDRYEIIPAAISALILGIPLAHIHGGELTLGSHDDAIRHSITKMSNIHFVASKTYLNRVIQLGENPKNIYLVGGLGLDNFKRLKLLDKKVLEEKLKFSFSKKSLLITFHPETISNITVENQIDFLLKALEKLNDVNFLFTMPNADFGNRIIKTKIKNFLKYKKNSKVFTSMGQTNYLSAMKYVCGVIGNSSSGIIEAPSLKKGTINIGDRQSGRIQAKSIINCKFEEGSLERGFKQLFSKKFQDSLKNVVNPYGSAGASTKILRILKSLDYNNIKKKPFYDIQSNY